jgi:predicted enzyme related to lactoylglutathione lyase
MPSAIDCERLNDRYWFNRPDESQLDFRRLEMTTATSTLLGRPVWYELMTTDMAAAETFYKNVIGWTSAPFRGSPDPYDVFKRGGDVQVAGLMHTPKGMNMPPFWSMYVAVPKLEEAVAHIKRLGGSELSGIIDVPSVGRLQMLKDPQGAAFYIIQPEPREERPEQAPEVGEASWHELMTTDAAAAMKFYTEVFGWQPSDTMDMGEMGKYYMFNRPFGMIGGMMNKPPHMANVPPYWGIYFRVADINAAVERVKANGGQILNGPMEVPGGDWIVNAMDPQGAAFSLHAKKAQ